jgi:hypothetical protein
MKPTSMSSSLLIPALGTGLSGIDTIVAKVSF